MGAPKELTGPTTVKGRVGSLKSISMSDDLVGWYNRLLVLVPEPIVHADRMTSGLLCRKNLLRHCRDTARLSRFMSKMTL